MRLQSAPPAARTLTGGAPVARHRVTPDRSAAARRYRERGIRLVEAGRPSAAISAFRRAIELDPGEAASHHALGRALLRLDRLAEAAASLSLATTLRDDAAAYHDLGVALHRQDLRSKRRQPIAGPSSWPRSWPKRMPRLANSSILADEDEEAARCFRRAAAAEPDAVAGRLNLAKACMLETNFSEAETQLRQALADEPQNDELMKYLGDVLARQGRFDEASEAFDRTLELNPRHVAAYFTMVEARKCTEADRPRLARMLAALDDAGLGDTDRVQLHFAIGKLLDDLGDYAEAMRHFDIANQRRRAAFDRVGFSADVDRIVRRFTPGFFAANSTFGREDDAPLMIVGLPRSGTTLIEQIISSHPQVAAGGELPFWVKRADPWGIAQATYLSTEMAHDLAGEYLAQLRRIGPTATRITDKQPFNLLNLGIIHLLLPKARIIQCRRHPVDTCLSIYFTNFFQVIGFATDKADLADAYELYARLMDHWRTVLPSDRFLEVALRGADRGSRGGDPADGRVQRSRLVRFLPAARAQQPGGGYRQPMAGAPAGLCHLG